MKSAVQTAEKLKKEIVQSYDSNPNGWNVFIGKDRRNFSQMMVTNGSHLWLLKEEWINPYKTVGLGAKMVGGAEILKNVTSQDFGLRPLTQRHTEELAELIKKEESPRDFLLQIMDSKPVSLSDLRSPLVLQGPIMASPNPLSLLSDKHQELDRRLGEELNNLLLRKHPQTIIPYL